MRRALRGSVLVGLMLALPVALGRDAEEVVERPGDGASAGVAQTASGPAPGSPAAPAPTAAALRAAPARADFERLRRAVADAWRARRARGGPLAGSPARARRPERASARALRLLDAGGLLERTARAAGAGGSTHTRYRLRLDGLPVWNRGGVVTEVDGRVVDRSGALALPPVEREPARIGRDEAIALARDRADVELLRAAPEAERGWLATGDPARTVPAWKVVLPASRPFGTFQVALDARTGDALAMVDLVRSGAAPGARTGTGRVFDRSLALPPATSDVPLFDLDFSGLLFGRIVRVHDARALAAFRPDGSFLFPAADPRFVQTSAYRGLTDTARFAEGLGFPAFDAGESILTVVNLPDPNDPTREAEFNNAFYDPFTPMFGFGNGDGVRTDNLGTDFDVAIHEMGHHVFQVLVEPLILSALDPVAAMTEGVADTFSALVGGDPDIGETTIPGAPYLRTLENAATFAVPVLPSDPHQVGLIYGGAHWDAIGLLGEDAFADVLLEALRRLPSDPLVPDYRDAFLAANQAVTGGLSQNALRQIFTDRGFDELDLPAEFEGILEDGVPETRTLADSPPAPAPLNFHLYVYAEFPDSDAVTFRTTGSGDVDLLVGPLFDPNAEAARSLGPTSNEQIVLLPGSSPVSVDDDDFWLIGVFDFDDNRASTYTLTAESTLPASQIQIDGAPIEGFLSEPGDVDLRTFTTSQPGEVVRVEVQALDPTLLPLVAVTDGAFAEIFGIDAGSGPGNDGLIQGARLPQVRTYVVVVFSLASDVDPSTGGGGYRLRLLTCDNDPLSAPDADGDGLVDACDDDDDDDGFPDAIDRDPLDAAACRDDDLDGCDDCSLGPADPFADGPDADGDGACDAGDPDDDNDGCPDADDPAPTAPSVDDDLDFLGDDCDDCPDAFDPDQADADGDGRGDVCECGDFDGNGFVTASDARSIQRCSVGIVPCEGLCDANDDGVCDTSDARRVQRFTVGQLGKESLSCEAGRGGGD